MKTSELEVQIKAALVGKENLLENLPLRERGIYHYIAPTVEPGRYPIIVYSPISDVPALSGDNQEIVHVVTIRIHVIASQKRFDLEERNFLAACDLVEEVMTDLGFVRRQTTSQVEDGKVMKVLDFVKGV